MWKQPVLGLAVLCLSPMGVAGVSVHVKGLDETLTKAVASGLQASQYKDRDITEAQIRRLYRLAPDEAKKILQPYGYFDAKVTGNMKKTDEGWDITLDVDPGKPVVVTKVDIALPDKAIDIPTVENAVTTFKPGKSEILNQGTYTKSRDAINSALLGSGFLDATMATHQVRVTTSEHSAVIDLAWNTGDRYRFGKVNFKGSQFRDGVLQRYIPWKPGDYFDQDDLLALQQRLNGADYFSIVNVQPDIEHKHDDTVDVDVDLKPAKRTVYTGGPFIATDTGIGVQFGLRRRWVNDRGHKWRNKLVLAQRLKSLDTLYTIPIRDDIHHAWNFGAKYREADTDSSHSKTLELIGNQTFMWHGWLVTAGVHALSGTFTVGERNGGSTSEPGIQHGNSTLVYPEISFMKKQADDPDFVQHGWSLTFAARSTVGSLLSDASFSQFTADAKWIHALNPRNRVILRGTAGVTYTDDFAALHPQLRFFAGGSRSNRGYGFEALGPRNSYDKIIGGKNLLVFGATMEHYFTPKWGMAAFVDAGNAFSDTDFEPAYAAGLGVRWRSPVGMIRVDLGTPINNDRHSGVQFNLVIGPDL